jgi:hypothetical protein
VDAGNLSADPALRAKQESHDDPNLQHVRLSRCFLMYWGGGILGTILIIVLILWLLGRL